MAPGGLNQVAAGVFSPGTTKRSTANMYDQTAASFQPLPAGPYECVAVQDQDTAQRHFDATREIQLKDKHGMLIPPSSYMDHYPAKHTPVQEPLPQDLIGPGTAMPFNARSTYDDQYWEKPRMGRPVEPMTYQPRPGPWLVNETTNQAFYKPTGQATGGLTSQVKEGRPAAQLPCALPSTWETTQRTDFIPKQAPGRQPTGTAAPRQYPPWTAGNTTYTHDYVPKELALEPVFECATQPYPFSGTTEQKDQYQPKDPYPVVPPLTGFVASDGLQLPLPRRSLGVEYWHAGQSNKYYVLIPRTTATPTSARQVFTTVTDNQSEACILVLYGDDPVASNNILLGQFDILHIPPAPKGLPRIEVKFKVDKSCLLTVEARDLDTQRHKLWQQRGDIVVLRA